MPKKKTETAKSAPVEEIKKEPVAEKKAEKPAPKKKAAAKPKTEKAVKTPAKVKEEPKATETKTAAKKAAPKAKPAAKKEAAKPVSVQIQFPADKNYSPDEIVEMCKEAYKGGKRKVIRTIEVYVNAAEAKAYYVVNGNSKDENGNDLAISL